MNTGLSGVTESIHCAPGQRGSAPAFVIPGATENPLAGLERRSVRLDAADEFFRGIRVPQVDVAELESSVGEVHVVIGKPGQAQGPWPQR